MTTLAEPVRTTPYKGLSPFDDSELDALLFFGREHETEIVVANALASRLTVLYGPSGVGKSSLLRAGVVHSLRKLTDLDPIAVAYYSSWAGDPLGGIEEAARGALAETFGGDPGDAAGDLADRLDAWTAALGCELCLVLDQFEELFLYHEEGGLLEALPELVTRPGLRVNVILGIRDDELAKLDIFKARIPGLFSNYLRLDLLDRDEARSAILGPLDRYNDFADEPIAIEPELVETVLGEVAAGRIDPGLTGRGAVNDNVEDRSRVETPYLQLVMQKLWEVEHERHSAVLRLATLAELGGAQRIVEDHLEHAMAALTPLQRDVAAGMFDHLVTPSGAKIAHGAADLASFAHVAPAEIEPVLSSLARERILRPTGEQGTAGDRYEIYHDVLAGAVLAWRAKHDAEMALVREREASSRRQRRLAVVAGISLTAFALMAFLAAYAISQRSTARHQAALARAQRANAVQKTRIAQAALQREAQGRLKYQHLSVQYRRTAAEQRRLKNEAKTQRDQLDQQYKALALSEAQLKQTNSDLAAQTRRANDKTALATRATTRAKNQTKLAKDRTAQLASANKSLTSANRKTRASELLSQAQAELATDPVQSVKDALASTKKGQTAGAEDVLRSALLATHLLSSLPAGGSATAAAYRSDGTMIAVASGSGGLRLFTVAKGQLVADFDAGSPLTSVAWAPGGAVVAAGAADGSVHLWDSMSKSLVRTISHGSPVVDLAYSPDGRLLATAGGRTVKLWDAASGLLVATLPHDRIVHAIEFSSDGKLLLSVSDQNAAHIWDVATGALAQTLTMGATITSAAFGPGGALVATASSDGTAKIWDTRSGVATEPLLGHTGRIYSIAFSPNGDRVVTGSIDGTARVWSTTAGLIDVIRYFTSPVLDVAFAPGGQSMVGIDRSGTAVTFGSGQLGVPLLGQRGTGRAAVFAPDATSVATVSGSTVRIWEPYAEPQLQGIHKSAQAATAITFDPTGKLLASGGTDGVVFVQKAAGRPVRALPIGSPVVALGWGTDNTLLIGTKDGTLHLRRGAAVNDARTIPHGAPLVAAALRTDGVVLASAGSDGAIRIWQTATGAKLLELHPGTGVTSVALDPTGRLVAAGVGSDIAVYDAHTGDQLKVLHGHTDTVTGVAFSPDGEQLASSSRDHDARIWDTKTFGLVKTLQRHTAFVSGVAFSGDGRWVATAGPLKAGVWAPGVTDLPNNFLFFVRGNLAPINAVAFSPHGWELATAARDGSIRVVDCKLCGRLPQLEVYARARLAMIHH
jgi:WD40 repeat protein